MCCTGWNEVWRDGRREYLRLLSTRTQAAFLQANLRREEEDLRRTIEKVEEAIVHNGPDGPKWLVILVNKADLYWGQLSRAQARYCLEDNRSSRFKTMITAFETRTANLGVRVEVMPYATCGENFVFDEPGLQISEASQLSANQISILESTLLKLLEELS